MIKARDLRGLPLLAFDTGKRIGEVKDTLLSPENRQVLAFLVDEGGWFEEARVIPFQAVKSIGPDAVIVPTEAVETKVSFDPTIKAAYDSRRVMTNLKAYSEDGRYLGTINDMVIDERTGEVTGYEVSGGFLADAQRGKRFMPAPETMTIGEEVVFVPAATATRMEEEVRGGLAMQMEKARSTGSAYVGEAREGLQTTRERVSATTREQQKNFVVGKTAKSPVTAPDGTVLVMSGETITRETADRAEQLGMLTDLVSSVGGAEAQSFLSRIQEEATRAYDEARRAVTGASERAREDTERKRIEEALGRPVTRVILDAKDRVILNTGEIVTNEAIRRAREAGALNILLNSISTQEPSFGIEERRAPRPGEARLEEHHHEEL